MATIQRPTKEGSVRTYQEKVGLGFVDILANEMDADLDTIYAAWNGGVDSVTLKDLSVTTPKLADGAVTGVKIAANAVGATQVLDGQITTAKLQLGASTPSSATGNIFELLVGPNSSTIVGGVNITVRLIGLIVGEVVGYAFSTVDIGGGAFVQCELTRDGTQVGAWLMVPPVANVAYGVSFPLTFLETVAGAHGYQVKITTGPGTSCDLSYNAGFNRHGKIIGIGFA